MRLVEIMNVLFDCSKMQLNDNGEIALSITDVGCTYSLESTVDENSRSYLCFWCYDPCDYVESRTLLSKERMKDPKVLYYNIGSFLLGVGDYDDRRELLECMKEIVWD